MTKTNKRMLTGNQPIKTKKIDNDNRMLPHNQPITKKHTRYTVNQRKGSSLGKVSPCWIQSLGIDSFDHRKLKLFWQISHSKHTKSARLRIEMGIPPEHASEINASQPTSLGHVWSVTVLSATTFNQTNWRDCTKNRTFKVDLSTSG